MNTTNLNTVTWEEAPAGFDATDTLYNTHLATINERDAILALTVDTRKAELTIQTDRGGWAHTSSTQDWPVFDGLFGRTHWQEFLAEWEAETVDQLER